MGPHTHENVFGQQTGNPTQLQSAVQDVEEGGGGAVAGAHDQRVQTQLGRRALAA